jgi:DNA repair protein RadC
VRQIFDALPNATVRAILENAVKDPQAMALLLQKGRTEKEQLDIANKLINYVGSLGVSVGKSASLLL